MYDQSFGTQGLSFTYRGRMTDPALSLSCQALGVTEFLETALTSRTVCIGGTLKMKRGQGPLERTWLRLIARANTISWNIDIEFAFAFSIKREKTVQLR